MVRPIDVVADLPIDRNLHIAGLIIIAHHGAKTRHIALTSRASWKREALRGEGLGRIARRRRGGLRGRRGGLLVAGGERETRDKRRETRRGIEHEGCYSFGEWELIAADAQARLSLGADPLIPPTLRGDS